ncbi:heparan-alpha-glucosaminide N-acetyltransferase domain-containing protein [Agromyces ramosus]|uniref:Membrane protein n=1 Tax=Agromyces ramosus TaxID=33879 RepID=A0ABU0RB20_9MICO|nr:heparan-alpha-glucosaminide N-acetyltransferase domain-containing protein [Agromyces ramosus]MDQ0895280.1 putative membrane protein [Agromyces ramosus]
MTRPTDASLAVRVHRVDRVDGVDAARGLALIGMFVAHVAPAVASSDLESVIAIADERPRLLFALTAGIGLGFMSGGVMPITEGRGSLRRQIAIRAVILIALGLLIAVTLHPLVFIILDVYGVAFLVLLPLIFIPPRVALGVGIALLVVTPALAEVASRTEAVEELQSTSAQLIVDWFVSGAYPIVIWIPVMLIGLALARLDLTSPRVVGIAALAGTTAAAMLLPIAAMLPGEEVATEASWAAPLRASLETVGNTGVGVLVVAGMMLLTAFARPPVRRVASALLSPVTAMGSMPLSVYTLHLVVIAASIRAENGVMTDDSFELLAGLVLGSMVFAWLWRRYLGRGPLERLLRWASGRSRADAAGGGATG